LVDDLEVWLKTQRFRISAKSRLGEKLSYIAKYMGRLKLSLEDGTVEMDSNIVERAIRPIALNRKNALFAGHDEGGRTWARIVSLIETCKLNGVEPYAYLKATDLPPEAPSFITRVRGSGFHILRGQFGQARRARGPQIAQALGALLQVFGCPEMSAV
jgi:hypothetical protein